MCSHCLLSKLSVSSDPTLTSSDKSFSSSGSWWLRSWGWCVSTAWSTKVVSLLLLLFLFKLLLKVSSYTVLLSRSLSYSLHVSVIDAYKYKVNGPIGFLFLASSKGQLMGGVHEKPRLQVFTLWPHFNSWNRIYVHIYIFLNKGSLELTTFFLMIFWVHLSQLGDHAVELCGSQMGISASSPK